MLKSMSKFLKNKNKEATITKLGWGIRYYLKDSN
jgi:hypothetical protein